VLANQQQRAARRHGLCRAHEDGRQLLPRQLQVNQGDEVESPFGGDVVIEIRRHQVNAFRHLARLCQTLPLLQRQPGKIDGLHRPALAGQPHCVAALARRQIQRPPRRQLLRMLFQ